MAYLTSMQMTQNKILSIKLSTNIITQKNASFQCIGIIKVYVSEIWFFISLIMNLHTYMNIFQVLVNTSNILNPCIFNVCLHLYVGV
jgi:hypothetical protein